MGQGPFIPSKPASRFFHVPFLPAVFWPFACLGKLSMDTGELGESLHC